MAYKLTILADNHKIDGNLRICWGFSCLVNENILFDTGESGEVIIFNIDRLGVQVEKIEKVVISHDHFDHTGGLEALLKRNNNVEVYLLSDFSDELKRKVSTSGAKVIESDVFKEIDANIYTTGKIEGEYGGSFMPEQAMVVKDEQGLTIITGCAHPGILNIVERVRKEFPEDRIFMVLGGFHLLDREIREVDFIAEELKKLGAEKVGPTHCTGEEAIQIFRNKYSDNFIPVGVGVTIEI